MVIDLASDTFQPGSAGLHLHLLWNLDRQNLSSRYDSDFRLSPRLVASSDLRRRMDRLHFTLAMEELSELMGRTPIALMKKRLESSWMHRTFGQQYT